MVKHDGSLICLRHWLKVSKFTLTNLIPLYTLTHTEKNKTKSFSKKKINSFSQYNKDCKKQPIYKNKQGKVQTRVLITCNLFVMRIASNLSALKRISSLSGDNQLCALLYYRLSSAKSLISEWIHSGMSFI